MSNQKEVVFVNISISKVSITSKLIDICMSLYSGKFPTAPTWKNSAVRLCYYVGFCYVHLATYKELRRFSCVELISLIVLVDLTVYL